MTPSGESSRLPATSSGGDDPLLSLATVRNRMDLLRRFLSDSVNCNARLGRDQMDLVSSEIASAIHQIIVSGAALLATAQQHHTPDPPPPTETSLRQPPGSGSTRPDPVESSGRNGGGDDVVVEIDAVELLAEHIHRCEICGKGFKRDANLRMHMRAHGNQFKTPEALAKPQPQIGGGEGDGRKHAAASSSSRFSCPFQGCNRNRMHRKFRPLKSVICVRNHFKRSHCPKTYGCNRCNKKHFSVLADLKNHLRHCGESKWKCSCGTSFSRKDKLFGHMALFEGHMPAVAVADHHKSTAAAEDDRDRIVGSAAVEAAEAEAEANSSNCSDNGLFESLLEEFGAVNGYCLQDIMLESPTTTGFSVAAGIGNNNNADSVEGFLNF